MSYAPAASGSSWSTSCLIFGTKSEKIVTKLEQMELELEKDQTTHAGLEAGAERVFPAKEPKVRPERKPLAEHLPLLRAAIAVPIVVDSCGSLVKMSLEQLEYIMFARGETSRSIGARSSWLLTAGHSQTPSARPVGAMPLTHGLDGFQSHFAKNLRQHRGEKLKAVLQCTVFDVPDCQTFAVGDQPDDFYRLRSGPKMSNHSLMEERTPTAMTRTLAKKGLDGVRGFRLRVSFAPFFVVSRSPANEIHSTNAVVATDRFVNHSNRR